ncbi:MAG TPA: hypothetical protein VHP81_04000, partial [Lachnospiraceae bacterium]|nr:hypothetical protein [Lachnospiraceae bacterium]
MNRFLKKEISTQTRAIICNVFLNMVLTLILMSFPLLQGKLVDVFVYSKMMKEFQLWILFLIILTIAQIIIRYFISKINLLKKEKFTLVINQKILNFLLRRHTKQVLAHEPTYLHSRVLQDSAAVLEFYFNTVSDVISCFVVMLV